MHLGVSRLQRKGGRAQEAPAPAQKQLLSGILGRASELQKGFPGETVGAVPSKSLGGLCVAPGDAWQHSVPSCLSRWVNEGLRCLSLTFGFVGLS